MQGRTAQTPKAQPAPFQPWRTALALAVIVFAPAALAPAAQALTLEFPGPATTTANLQQPLTSYRLPIGPWRDGNLKIHLAEGALDQTAWRLTAPDNAPLRLTTLAIMAPLRAQLAASGWTVIFECETAACGGYDFRYSTEVLPEPDMHVDLGDFRYLCAERSGPDGPEYLSLMVSRSAVAGFVQLTRIGGETLPAPQFAASTKSPLPAANGAAPADPPSQPAAATDLGTRLETGGAIALDDLVFASGAAALAAGDFASLTELAAYLRANPGRSVALVGHTDASGALGANIALSRKRAQAVRQHLIDSFGLPASQIAADGVGFLSPRASNLTDEGRTLNRRVEVMLTSTR